MVDIINTMSTVSFLHGFTSEELWQVGKCLKARIHKYKKTEIILAKSEPAKTMGVILSGRVLVADYDVFGNRNILADLQRGDALAAGCICAQIPCYLTTYIAVEQSEILMLNYERVFGCTTINCNIRSRILENTLQFTASELLSQNCKINCISQRNIREKLISFLSHCVREHGTKSFNIRFSRQELADYLCVNRSAMSKELCLMRDEGLLRFNKNHFEILIDGFDSEPLIGPGSTYLCHES